MAKGDSGRAQQAINQQGANSQNYLSGVQNTIGNTQNTMNQNYNSGVGASNDLYNQILQGNTNLTKGLNVAGTGPGGYGGAGISLDPYYKGFLDRNLQGYENFANTGGFSAQDLQNIRNRSVAPAGAIYGSAQDAIRRNQVLQGGYAPNAIAAQTKLARDVSGQIGDLSTNAEANIAQMVQQGKLAGLSGMQQGSQLGLQDALTVAQHNAAAANAAAGNAFNAQLTGLRGLQSLYGDTPGLASLYGGQLLNSNNQLLNAAGQQTGLGNSIVNQQIQKGQMPSDWSQAMNNIKGGLGLAGGIAAMF